MITAGTMALDDRLVARIRGEYEEMPGLRLTVAQACRLWQVDAATCVAILDRLVAECYLHRTHDGAYAAFPSTRARTAKATLPDSRSTAPRSRYRA